jgi:hypothetical protein
MPIDQLNGVCVVDGELKLGKVDLTPTVGVCGWGV